MIRYIASLGDMHGRRSAYECTARIYDYVFPLSRLAVWKNLQSEAF